MSTSDLVWWLLGESSGTRGVKGMLGQYSPVRPQSGLGTWLSLVLMRLCNVGAAEPAGNDLAPGKEFLQFFGRFIV